MHIQPLAVGYQEKPDAAESQSKSLRRDSTLIAFLWGAAEG
jgi:hypothetical protein